MTPETRTKNLFALLGWQGGTIHDACKEVGLDISEFLHSSADFDERGPCNDFMRGYYQAADIALYLHRERGNLQYWYGAICAVQNNYEAPSL